jgi:hypothetical protein
MVGGRGELEICRPSFPFQRDRKQLLRPCCDARGFKPLLIEIIARQKVAPAFEPQKWSPVDGPT